MGKESGVKRKGRVKGTKISQHMMRLQSYNGFFFERQSYRGKGKGKKTKRLKGINKYFQPLKGIA